MPYIKSKKQRIELDVIAREMSVCLQCNGDLNYLLYAYCLRYVPQRYNAIKNFLGELTEAASEIRRRQLVPREKKAIKENGDVQGLEKRSYFTG